MNSTTKKSYTLFHNEEGWKILKEIDSSHHEALSQLYSLGVSAEGHRQYLYVTPTFAVDLTS